MLSQTSCGGCSYTKTSTMLACCSSLECCHTDMRIQDCHFTLCSHLLKPVFPVLLLLLWRSRAGPGSPACVAPLHWTPSWAPTCWGSGHGMLMELLPRA